MRFFRYAVGLLALFAPALALGADGDLTLRARAILYKHCAECHKGVPGGQGEMSVLDRAGMERPARPFLTPDGPGQPQLLQLIEEGSMPPGNRPKVPENELQVLREWVGAQAPAYPRSFDDEYALASMVADLEKLPPAERPHQRYFSLTEFMQGKDTEADFRLEPKRSALLATLKRYAKETLRSLRPADPCGTVLALDLRQAGWNLQPFEEARRPDKTTVPGAANLNLFDLILLEYPLGRLYPVSKSAERLTDLFLRPAAPVRPILFLKGAWVMEDLARPPLSAVAEEIRRALDVAGGAAPEDRIAVDMAPKPPLAIHEPVDQNAILPLDAITIPAFEPKAPFHVFFETLNFKTRERVSKFRPREQLAIGLRISSDDSTSKVHVEIQWASPDGTRAPLNLVGTDRDYRVVEVGDQLEFPSSKDNRPGYTVTKPKGQTEKVTDALTIFASEKGLPEGLRLVSKSVNGRTLVKERVVHDFYPPRGAPPTFDPARLVKKTIYIEIE
jgi:hypothetical protein